MNPLEAIEFLSQKITFSSQERQISQNQLKGQQQQSKLKILNILKGLEMKDIINILEKCKQKTLFVLLLFFSKQFQIMKDSNKIWYFFQSFNQLFARWSNNQFFQRSCQTMILQYHHQGIIGKILGQLLKNISSLNTMQTWNKILSQILKINKKYYQMFVINNYFCQMENFNIDESAILGNLLKNFQIQIISQTIKIIGKNIKQVEQNFNKRQFSEIQTQFCQEITITKYSYYFHNQMKYLIIIFEILRKIVSFKFEVNQAQSDDQLFQIKHDQTECLQFSSNIISLIIKQDFIKSLYFIVQNFLSCTNFSRNLNQQRTIRFKFIQTAFDFLSKIIKTKSTNYECKLKQIFVRQIISGQNKLIKIRSSPYVMLRIMQGNCKLIKNVELNQILQWEQGKQWINLIFLYSKMIIKQTKITVQNELGLKSINLIKKILFQAFLYELDNNKQQFNVSSFAIQFQTLCLQNIIFNQKLVLSQNLPSLAQLQEQKKYFFKDIHAICSCYIGLKQINKILRHNLKNCKSQVKLSNIFMLLSQLLTIFNSQKVSLRIQSQDIYNFGQSILYALHLIQICLQQFGSTNNNHLLSDSHFLLKQAIFFMIHKLLSQNIQHVDVSQCSMRIISNLYICIAENLLSDISLKYKNEGFFYQLFKYCFKLIGYSPQKLATFILQNIKPLLSTYKALVYKHHGKTSQYFQALKKDFQNLRQADLTSFSIQFKITLNQIAPILCYNHSKSQTKNFIQKQALKINELFSSNYVASICRFCGLLSFIQKQEINFYLIQRIGTKNISNMMQSLLKFWQVNSVLFFELSHKMMKISAKKQKNINIRIKILSFLLQGWIKIIQLSRLDQHLIEKNQLKANILQTFQDISSNQTMNFYLLQKHPLLKANFKSYLNYIGYFIDKTINCLHQQNSQVQNKLLINLKIIFKVLSDYFVSADLQIKITFHKIIISFLQFFVTSLNNAIFFNVKYNNSLIYKLCQINLEIFSYFHFNQKRIHKKELKQYSESFYQKQRERIWQIYKLLYLYQKTHKLKQQSQMQQIRKIQSIISKIYPQSKLPSWLKPFITYNKQSIQPQILNQKQSESEITDQQYQNGVKTLSQNLNSLNLDEEITLYQY